MDKKVVFHHIRNKNQPRGNAVTLAMEVNEQNQVVAWAEAKCHPKDNFCKHTGRVKAAGRLQSPKYRNLTSIVMTVTVKEFLEIIVPTYATEIQ